MLRRARLISIFIWMGLLHVSYAQLIDTIRERCITTKSSVNEHINIINRMVVTAKQPQKFTHKGRKIKNGYDVYYIHVIRAREVWIKVTKVQQDSSIIYDVQKYFVYHGLEPSYLDSAKIANRNNVPIYLAIATKSKRLPTFKSSFTSNALFIKGMIDNSDSLIYHYENELKNLQYIQKKLAEWIKQKTNLYPSIEKEIEKLIKERDQLRGGVDVADEDSTLNPTHKKEKKKELSDSTQVNKQDSLQNALEKKKQEEKQKKQAKKKQKEEQKKKKKEEKKKKKEAKQKKKKKTPKNRDTTHKVVKDSSKIWKKEYKKLDKQGYKPKESKLESKIKSKNALIKEFVAIKKSLEWIILNDYDVEKEDSLILDILKEKLFEFSLKSKEKQEELKLYKDFKSAKGKDKKLLDFFLSHHFAVSFKYTIRSNPYDLPKYIPEEEVQKGISRPEQEKHKVKRKLFHRKGS